MNSRSSSPLEAALSNRSHRNSASRERHPVVVIDDDKASRESLAFVLGDQYEVITCATAKDGVAAVHEDICVVIIDVRMPEQDGFATCDEIRRKCEDIPVIFYSAYQGAKDPMDIINDHRPFAYVVKGGNLNRLIDVVRLAVQLQSMVIQNRKIIRRLQPSKNTVR
jgi:DNA-binding NtrC family response regulator